MDLDKGPLLELDKGPLLELNKGPLLELAAVDKMVNSRDTGRRENSDFWLQ